MNYIIVNKVIAPRIDEIGWAASGIFPLAFGGELGSACNAKVTGLKPCKRLTGAVVAFESAFRAILLIRDFIAVDPEWLIEALLVDRLFVVLAVIAAYHKAADRNACHFVAVKGLVLGCPVGVTGDGVAGLTEGTGCSDSWKWHIG